LNNPDNDANLQQNADLNPNVNIDINNLEIENQMQMNNPAAY